MASFRQNANVARSYVSSQLLKGWFMAKAQIIVVFMSCMMLFMGVVLLYANVKLGANVQSWEELAAALPIAIVAAPLAIVIEGMNIVASRNLGDTKRKVEQEIGLLHKTKKAYTKEELEEREKKIRDQYLVPAIMVLVFSGFSVVGAEIFWHKLTENSSTFFQVIGYIIGFTTSAALIYLEIEQDKVERGIDRSISASAMIYRAMEMDTKGQILNQFSIETEKQLKSPEMTDAIAKGAKQNIFGPMAEIMGNMGSSIEAEQLRRIVDGKIAERDAADELLASGGERDTDSIPQIGPGARKEYKTEQGRKVGELIKKYGRKNVEDNIEEYAQEGGMSSTTLRRHLKA